MSITIENAKLQHIESMIPLLKVLFSIEADFTFSPEKHRTALEAIITDTDCGCLVALQNDQVIGMCSAQWVYSTATGQKSAWLEDVIVEPEHQGKGVGKQLIEEMIKWCQSNGCNRMQLAYDQQNQPAIDFYQKHHFQLTQLRIMTQPI